MDLRTMEKLKGFKTCEVESDENSAAASSVEQLDSYSNNSSIDQDDTMDMKLDPTFAAELREQRHRRSATTNRSRKKMATVPVKLEKVKAEKSNEDQEVSDDSENDEGNSSELTNKDDSSNETSGDEDDDWKLSMSSDEASLDGDDNDEEHLNTKNSVSGAANDGEEAVKDESGNCTEKPKCRQLSKPPNRRSNSSGEAYKRFICHHCDKRFRSKPDLKQHQIFWHGPPELRPYKCPLCTYSTCRTGDRRRHLRRTHGLVKTKDGDYIEVPPEKQPPAPKRLLCDICGYGATDSTHLIRHKKRHSSEKPFVCDHPGCSRRYKLEDHLKRHAKKHTEGTTVIRRQPNSRDPSTEMFHCPVSGCEYKTSNSVSLRQHSAVHSDDEPFACDFPGCAFTSKWPTSLRMHRVNHYPDLGYRCSFPGCDFSTANRKRHKDHELTHGSAMSFKCDFKDCGYRAKTEILLMSHRRTSHGAGLIHQCPHCPRKFAKRSFLLAHVRNHESGVIKSQPHRRSFECSECGWICRTQRKLKLHVRVHRRNQEEVKEPEGKEDALSKSMFQCPECDKICRSERNLRIHMGACTKKIIEEPHERPVKQRTFQCPQCDKMCNNEFNLQKHMNTHGKERATTKKKERRINRCHHCGKICRTDYNLRSHMRTHRPSEPNDEHSVKLSNSEDTIGLSCEEFPIKIDPELVKVELEEFDCYDDDHGMLKPQPQDDLQVSEDQGSHNTSHESPLS